MGGSQVGILLLLLDQCIELELGIKAQLNQLSLSLLIFKMGIATPASKGYCKD